MSWPVEMPPRMPPAWLARKVGLPSCHPHLVGIVFAGHCGGREAVADFHALHGVDAHHGPGQIAVELVVERVAPADGNAGCHDLDHRADEEPRLRTSSR